MWNLPATTWRRRAVVTVTVAVLVAANMLTAAAGDEVASELDAPEGYAVEILAGHTTFPDDVAAHFRFNYDEGGARGGTTVRNLSDASTLAAANVEWELGGTSGWHTHPGPVIVAVTEGSVEVTNASDCVARTYEAGEAFVDPGQGNIHVAANASEANPAAATAMFFGIPDGEPATVWVEPVDC
jgi:quercetin dioxygenase-like cupin family protein